jgi:CheY-like chemotaxis protein
VFIYLPRAATPAAPRTDGSRPPFPGATGPATTLLIEPEELVRQVTTEALTELGHSVVHAADGAAALALLERGEPVDLVICPAAMPEGGQGGDFAREARRLRPGVRVLLTTDDPLVAEATDRAEAAVGAVTKPYGPKRLGAAIADLLGGR